MSFDMTPLLQLPADEQERIALELLRNINEDVQEEFLTPEQEHELDLGLQEFSEESRKVYSIKDVKELMQEKWRK